MAQKLDFGSEGIKITPLLPKKLYFSWGVIKFFIPNVDYLLGLAYPESLRSIGLMVEAVDSYSTGWVGLGRVGSGVVSKIGISLS